MHALTFSETYYSYLMPGLRNTDDIVKVTDSNAKVGDIIFQKCTFSDRGVPIDGLPSETI